MIMWLLEGLMIVAILYMIRNVVSVPVELLFRLLKFKTPHETALLFVENTAKYMIAWPVIIITLYLLWKVGFIAAFGQALYNIFVVFPGNFIDAILSIK